MHAVRILVVAAAVATAQVPPPPHQPFAFSHRIHEDHGMECATCHPNSDPGKDMGIPPLSECMTCHETVAQDDPAIRKLALSVRKKHPAQWARVYNIPAFVRFSHRRHLAAGTRCEECHGPVATRDELALEYPMTQKGCLACHVPRHVGTNQCFLCHD